MDSYNLDLSNTLTELLILTDEELAEIEVDRLDLQRDLAHLTMGT